MLVKRSMTSKRPEWDNSITVGDYRGVGSGGQTKDFIALNIYHASNTSRRQRPRTPYIVYAPNGDRKPRREWHCCYGAPSIPLMKRRRKRNDNACPRRNTWKDLLDEEETKQSGCSHLNADDVPVRSCFCAH